MEIDNYSLTLFKDCPKRYEFRMVQHLESCASNLPAQFGIALHAGLDSLYQGKELIYALKAFDEVWSPLEGMDSKSLYTGQHGMSILSTYQDRYLNDGETLHVEAGFAVELPPLGDASSTPHVLRGRIDRVKKDDGLVITQDHKSRSKSPDSYCMYPNFQLLGYSYGCKELLGLDYYPAIEANIIAVKKKFDPSYLVLRIRHQPTNEEMESYFDAMCYWLAKLCECHNFNHFPMVGSEFTCAWCAYKPLCEAPHMKDRLIEGGAYRISEWKPY